MFVSKAIEQPTVFNFYFDLHTLVSDNGLNLRSFYEVVLI